MGLIQTVHHDHIAGYVANQHIDWTNATENFLTTGSATCGLLTNAGNWAWTGESIGNWSDARKDVALLNNDNVALNLVAAGMPYLQIKTTSGSEALNFGNPITNQDYNFFGSGLITLGGDLLVNGGNIGITGDTDLLTLTSGQLEIDADIKISAGSITSDSGVISFGDEDLFTTGDLTVDTTTLNVSSLSGGGHGTVGIGTAASDSALLLMSESSDKDGVEFNLVFGVNLFEATGSNQTIKALKFDTIVSTSSNQTLFCGIDNSLTVNPQDPLTMDEVCGINNNVVLQGSKNEAVNYTNMYLFKGNFTPSGAAGVTIDNTHGLFLPDMTGMKVTNPWSIFSLGGNMAHVGNVRIGDTTKPIIATFEVNGSSLFISDIGFFNTTPVTQNQLQTGVGATVDNVITELQRLGLVRQAA